MKINKNNKNVKIKLISNDDDKIKSQSNLENNKNDFINKFNNYKDNKNVKIKLITRDKNQNINSDTIKMNDKIEKNNNNKQKIKRKLTKKNELFSYIDNLYDKKINLKKKQDVLNTIQ